MKGKGIWLVGLVIVLVVMSGPLFVSQTQSATGPQPLSPLPSTPVPKPTATASFTATPTVTPTTRITDSTTSPVEPRLHRWVSATDPITATATVSDTCKPPPACACSLIWPCRLTPPRDGEVSIPSSSGQAFQPPFRPPIWATFLLPRCLSFPTGASKKPVLAFRNGVLSPKGLSGSQSSPLRASFLRFCQFRPPGVVPWPHLLVKHRSVWYNELRELPHELPASTGPPIS